MAFFKKKDMLNLDKITVIIIIIFFSYFIIEDSLNIVIPLFFKEQKINIVLYGTLLAFTRVVRAVIVIPISFQTIYKKFTILKTILILDIIILLSFIKTSSQVIIFAGFCILIITTSVINVILNPIMGVQAKDRVGIVFGIRDTFLYAGCFLGLLITGTIKDLPNGTDIIWIFYSCIFALIFIEIYKLEKKIKNKPWIEIPKEQKPIKQKTKKRLLGLNKDLIYYIIVVFILGIAGAYSSYLPLIALDKGIQENSIFYIFSSSTLITAILAIFGGLAIDKFNKKKLFQLDILILIVILALFSVNNKIIFIIALIISGLATALDNVINAYVFANFSEDEVNRFWGIIGSVSLASFSLGTFLGGLVYELNYIYLFVFAITLNVIGLILSLKLKDVEKSKI